LAAQDARLVRAAATVAVFAVCVGAVLAGIVTTATPAFAATDPGTGIPCTVAAKACVNLATQQAWLISNGAVIRGPLPVGSGGPGEETPTGTFHVLVKDKNHVSAEQGGTPMPYSVFFAPGGVAFHGGNLRKASAGCVHLDDTDAIAFYDTLQIGDQVEVLAAAAPTPRPKRQVPPPARTPPPATPLLPRDPHLTLPKG